MVRGRNNPEIINGREFDEEGFDRTNASTWVEYKVDKKRLIKAYKGKGSFARFNLLVWKLIFYKAWFSATGATLFRPFARNATVTHRTKKGDWWERGRGTGGKQRYRSERIHASFFFPFHCYVDIVPLPKPAYLRAFRTVLFAFSLSANWNSRSLSLSLSPLYTPRIPTLCPSPLSFLSFILPPLHPASVPSPSLLLLAHSRTVCYLLISVSPFVPIFSALLYRSIILFHGCFYARRRGGKNRHALVERGSRALLKFRSRSPRDLLRIFYERIFSNSRARSEMKVKMRFFFFKLIFERASNGQIVRGGNVVYIERVHGVRYTIRRCNSAGNYYATRTNATSLGLRYRCLSTFEIPE